MIFGDGLSGYPSSRLFRAGKGWNVLLASSLSILLSEVIFFTFPLDVQSIYYLVKPYTLPAILAVILYLSFKNGKSWFFFFLLSSMLGFVSYFFVQDSLFSLISGFFSVPVLISTLKESRKDQLFPSIKEVLKAALEGTVMAYFLAPIFVSLPSLSSAGIAMGIPAVLFSFSSLSYVAAINSFYTFQTLYAFRLYEDTGVARLGLLRRFKPEFIDWDTFLVFSLLSSFLLPVFLFLILKMPIAVIRIFSFLSLLLLMFSNLSMSLGNFLVFVVSSILGVLTSRLNVSKTSLLGSVMLPTVLFLLRLEYS